MLALKFKRLNLSGLGGVRWLVAAGAFVAVGLPAEASDFDGDYDVKAWEELQVQLPAAPRSEAFLPVYVSATTENKFQVDADSITVGSDGVVRYSLVIVSASGAQNVSYEGMRCATAERRLYAFGRSDGSWSKARSNRWVKIQESTLNRHHAALFREFFCPEGMTVRDADEARMALRQGGYPATLRR